MNDNIFQSLNKLKSGTLSSTLTRLSQGSPMADCLKAVNALNSHLVQKIGDSQFISDFSALCVDLSDDFVNHGAIFDADEIGTMVTVINQEDTTIVEQFLDLHDGSNYELSDRSGRQFQLIVDSAGLYEDENRIVYINASSEDFSSKFNVLWFNKQTNNYELSELIPTLDSTFSQQDIREHNLLTDISIINEVLGKYNYPDDIIGAWSNLEGNTGNLIEIIHNTFPDIQFSNIAEGTMLVRELLNVTDHNVKFTTIYDLMHDQLESMALNETLQSVTTSIVNNNVDDGFFQSVMGSEQAKNYDSISDTLNKFWRTFKQGGLRALISSILSLGSTAISASTEDGLLVFTDNNDYAPAVYLSGFISGVIGVATTMATTILAVINPILGVAVGLLGTIGSLILKGLQYDESCTRIGINDSMNVNNDALPISCYQIEQEFSISSNPYILQVIQENLGISCFEVPGGYIYAGPGGYDANTMKVNKIRLEFHPSAVNSLAVWNAIKDEFFWSLEWTNSDGIANDYLNLRYEIKRLIGNRRISDAIFELWNDSNIDSSFYQNDTSDGDQYRLSATEDNHIRRCMALNTAIFLLWIIDPSGVYRNIEGAITADGSGYHVSNELDALDYAIAMTPTMRIYTKHFQSTGTPMAVNWAFILSNYNNLVTLTSGYNTAITRINGYKYFGLPTTLSSKQEYMWVLPKYDSKTFVFALIGGIVVATAVAVVATCVTFKVRNYIRKKRALNQAKVNQAWDQFSKSPTAENYTLYKQAARRNNLSTYVYGGDKVNLTNYWGEVTSINSPGVRKISSSLISSISRDNQDVTLSDIAKLITGV